MINDDDKLQFFGLTQSKNFQHPVTTVYSIFVNTINGKFCKKQDTKFSISQSRTLLYDIPIALIKNRTEYLPTGTLTIYFEFRTLSVIHSNIYSFYNESVTQTDIDFVPTEIFDSTFVTLIINEEQTVQASKFLLCSKSKVFKAMFDSGLQESQTNEIKIRDIRYDILKELLLFLETGHLSKKLEEIRATNINIIHELFIAADKYEIKDLKLKCELCLIRNTTIKNAVEHLEIAHLYNGTKLKEYAKNFIKLYLTDIMTAPEFVILMKDYPELINQIKDITLSKSVSNVFF